MKLQRNTWILIGFALILGGGVYFTERQNPTPTEVNAAQSQKLFNFEESQVQTLVVKRAEDTLKFKRTEDETQPWQMTAPESVPASEPAIAFLLNFLIEPQIERRFSTEGDRLSEYGLDDPFATITVTVADSKDKQTLLLGQPNYDEKFLYALANPSKTDAEEVEVFLIPYAIRYAVEREYEEWKQASLEDKEESEEVKP
ncbi:MAG: DUF4340 domain-containing protein [Jaaginema sp. PMC 1079.18]|nr:DUF4340 domain-containing protein [Jaaginema sp. PMC 1080.18]MEC4851955.1 DUF4340 domain-containing protein [Jaaginema sp. PMC 1079.18]MEC4868479.1 DUF4340 domain-containing protein [Jaaginema sp. PMC 1078.18]